MILNVRVGCIWFILRENTNVVFNNFAISLSPTTVSPYGDLETRVLCRTDVRLQTACMTCIPLIYMLVAESPNVVMFYINTINSYSMEILYPKYMYTGELKCTVPTFHSLYVSRHMHYNIGFYNGKDEALWV